MKTKLIPIIIITSLLFALFPLTSGYAETQQFDNDEDFHNYLNAQGIELESRNLGRDADRQTYNKYNLVVYGKPWGDTKPDSICDSPTGTQPRYLGYTLMDDDYTNTCFPPDAIGSDSPEDWDYLNVYLAEPSWGDILISQQNHMFSSTLTGNGATQSDFNVNYIGGTSKAKVQSASTWRTGGSVYTQHKASSGKTFYATFYTPPMVGDTMVSGAIHTPNGTSYTMAATENSITVPFDVVANASIIGHATTQDVISLQASYGNNNKSVSKAGSVTLAGQTKTINRSDYATSSSDAAYSVKIQGEAYIKNSFNEAQTVYPSQAVQVTIQPSGPDPYVTAEASTNPDSVLFNDQDISVTVTAKGTLSNNSDLSNVKEWRFYARHKEDTTNATLQTKIISGSALSRQHNFQFIIPATKVTGEDYTQNYIITARASFYNPVSGNSELGDSSEASTYVYKQAPIIQEPSDNEPPVAVISSPYSIKAGSYATIRGTSSYDPDGTVVLHQWELEGASNQLNNDPSGDVLYMNEGTFPIFLVVCDNEGACGYEIKPIRVTAPAPNANFETTGTLKENRKFTLVSNSRSSAAYPINAALTSWTITPLSGGTASDIKYSGSLTGTNTKDLLIKKAGDYRIQICVENTAGYSDCHEKTIEIKEDAEPIADFSTITTLYRSVYDDGDAIINLEDYSISPDGDEIVQRTWYISYDSDNDGSFADETRIMIDNTNKKYIEYKSDQVGQYLIDLEAKEAFGQPTIQSYITDADYKRGDSDAKPTDEKVVEINNLSPSTSFGMVEKNKIELSLLHDGSIDMTENELASHINSEVIPSLSEQNIEMEYSIGKVNKTTEELPSAAAGTLGNVFIKADGTVWYKKDLWSSESKISSITNAKTVSVTSLGNSYGSNYYGSERAYDAFSVLTNDNKLYAVYTSTYSSPGYKVFLIDYNVKAGAVGAEFENGVVYALTDGTLWKRPLTGSWSSLSKGNRTKIPNISNVKSVSVTSLGYRDYQRDERNKNEDVFSIITEDNQFYSLQHTYEVKNYSSNNSYDFNSSGLIHIADDVKTGVSNHYDSIFIKTDGTLWGARANGVYKTQIPEIGNADKLSLTSWGGLSSYAATATKNHIFTVQTSDLTSHRLYYTSGEWRVLTSVLIINEDKTVTFHGTQLSGISNAKYLSYTYMSYSEYSDELNNGHSMLTVITEDNKFYNVRRNNRSRSISEYLASSNIKEPHIIEHVSSIELEEFTDDLSDKYFIYISDNDITDGVKLELNQFLIHDPIQFIGMGNSYNKVQIEDFIINNDYNGNFIDNSDLNLAFETLTSQMITTYFNDSVIDTYITLDQKVDLITDYSDPENDPKYEERWMYTHNSSIYENNQGTIANNGNFISTPISTFDKVGKYEIWLQKRDNPKNNNLFDNYRKWSDGPGASMILYVHRKPIAQFTASRSENGTSYDITIRESSYDEDHQSLANQGIVQKVWRWKDADSSAWTSGFPPAALPAGKTYLVSLKVQDLEGAWSDDNIQVISTTEENAPPVALFQVDPVKSSISQNITITDLSNDPNGDPIAQYLWTVEKEGVQLYNGSTKPTSTSLQNNATANGVDVLGFYTITLQVQDNPGSGSPMWSEPFSKTVEIANADPAANMTNPNGTQTNPSLLTSSKPTFSWSQTDSDPGTAFKQYQVQVLNETNTQLILDSGIRAQNTISTAQSWTTSIDLPSKKLQVRVRVNDGSIWSNWSNPTWFTINSPPAADFDWSPKPLWEGDTVTLLHRVTDPDNDTLQVRYTVTRPNTTQMCYPSCSTYYTVTPAQYNSNGPSFVADDPGTYTVLQTVTDGKVAAVNTTKTITVNNITITGEVNHTDLWNSNRIKYNQSKTVSDNDPRTYDVFFPGEKFLLRASTSDNISQLRVSILGSSYETLLTRDGSSWLWIGDIWDEEMIRWGNQFVTFRFAAYSSSSSYVEYHNVIIEIDDDEYWRQHRSR